LPTASAMCCGLMVEAGEFVMFIFYRPVGNVIVAKLKIKANAAILASQYC
jgi:hypothetical protein